MYRAAEALIEAGHAYVDEQTADEMRHHRGDFGHAGVASRYRSRSADENLARFRDTRAGDRSFKGSFSMALGWLGPSVEARIAVFAAARSPLHHKGDLGSPLSIVPAQKVGIVPRLPGRG